MRDHYQQQENIFAQTMADRQEWENATAAARHLAIAADAELRRRHPDTTIKPLRSAEPAPVSDAERAQLRLTPGKPVGERSAGSRISPANARYSAARSKNARK